MARLRRRDWLGCGLGAVMCSAFWPVASGQDRVLRVGPQRKIKTIAEAALNARSGDTVEVDAGVYNNDVAVWTQAQLRLRAVGGRVQLRGGAASAENKGIWVNRCDELEIDGFDFTGAGSSHGNGAGIRHERGRLSVRDCSFMANQNGILTGNDGGAALTLEACEFGANGAGDGQTHNVYVGRIDTLTVRACWFHDARGGHLLKSRARSSRVEYSMLADGPGGRSSYELEFAEGGIAVVLGNLMVQTGSTENPHIVSYGTEGYRGAEHRLLMVHNTLVDRRRQGGVHLRVRGGSPVAVALWNNLFVGAAAMPEAASAAQGNHSLQEIEFEDASAGDFRLRRSSSAWRQAVVSTASPIAAETVEQEYLHPCRLRPLTQPPLHPGASQTSPLARASN